MSQSNVLALVDIKSKRAFLIGDKDTIETLKPNYPNAKIIEVISAGLATSTMSLNSITQDYNHLSKPNCGSITTICISDEENKRPSDGYHIIRNFRGNMDIEEAYELIS